MRLKIATAFAVLAVAAGTASAATYTVNLDPTLANQTVSFASMTSGPSFTDTFNFVFSPATFPGSSFGGAFASQFTFSAPANIDFSSATLNGMSATLTNVVTNIGPFNVYQSTLVASAIGNGSNPVFSLVVNGTGAGNYMGTLDVATTPVPEPGTYAMLLAGLAAVGFVAKRRSTGI